jgi:hypothetical protein
MTDLMLRLQVLGRQQGLCSSSAADAFHPLLLSQVFVQLTLASVPLLVLAVSVQSSFSVYVTYEIQDEASVARSSSHKPCTTLDSALFVLASSLQLLLLLPHHQSTPG